MDLNFKDITTIGFDADDTLWVNETYFREAEEAFTALLEPYETKNTIDQELFRMEMRNLELYGYGIKGFVLSMIESALELSNGRVPQDHRPNPRSGKGHDFAQTGTPRWGGGGSGNSF